MKVIDEYHKYELAPFEEGGDPQVIQFIKKIPRPDGLPGELVTLSNGTTNEEVIRVLLNRLEAMNAKFPCRENSLAITKLQEALMWLEWRTKSRKERGVEGKALA
jgi:hypothetical protein